MTRGAAIASICAVTIGLDRITKLLAQEFLRARAPRIYLGDFFRLQYVENPGAFLSLGSGLSMDSRIWSLTVAVGLLLVIMAWILIKKRLDRWTTIALSLLLAGGAGNWIDRAFRRAHTVVDFMNVGIGGLRTGIFNVADMAITAGVAILIIRSLRDPQK